MVLYNKLGEIDFITISSILAIAHLSLIVSKTSAVIAIIGVVILFFLILLDAV